MEFLVYETFPGPCFDFFLTFTFLNYINIADPHHFPTFCAILQKSPDYQPPVDIKRLGKFFPLGPIFEN